VTDNGLVEMAVR